MTQSQGAAAGALTSDAIVAALQSSGFPVTDIVDYTAETDLNHLLGRPNQYVVKVSWTDQRVPGQPQAATIEVFPDPASLDARQKYTTAISDSGGLFAQYIYRNDARLGLLRLPARTDT